MESGKGLDALKSLYAECFNDSKAVTDHLFSTKLGIHNAVIGRQDGNIVGALYLVDKTLSYLGSTIDYPFIVALGVAKAMRGKGEASRIVYEALKKVAQNNLPFVGLYPAITGFYEQLGFSFISRETSLNSEGLQLVPAQEVDTLLSLYNDAICNLDFYYPRNKVDIKVRLAEIGADLGEGKLIYRQGKLVGYTLGEREEFVLDGQINYHPKGKQVAGHMARIANLGAAFKLAKVSLPFAFRVKDDIIAENNQTFAVNDGILTLACNASYTIDIKELTALFFGTSLDKNAAAFQPYFRKIKGQIAEKY